MEPTKEVMMCPNCKVEMVDGACPKCGMKAEDVNPAPAAPAEETNA